MLKYQADNKGTNTLHHVPRIPILKHLISNLAG